MSETSYAQVAKTWEFAEKHALEQQNETQRQAREQVQQTGRPQGSAAQAGLLTFLARTAHASCAISVGTDSIVEALALACGLTDHGRLTAVDSSALGITDIRKYCALNEEETHNNISLRAVNTPPSVFLPKLNPHSYDLIAVSGGSDNYAATLTQAPYLLREHGLIVFTDILGVASPDTKKSSEMQDLLQSVEDSECFNTTLTPIGTGLLFASLK